MTKDVVGKIGAVGIIPVVRASTVDEALRAVEAIRAGGIAIVEITLTVPDAPRVIETVVRQYGEDILVGAGTVLTGDQARACLDSGVEFLVSPGLSVQVLKQGFHAEKLTIPGILSPTELMSALAEGARVLKVFPCGCLGGPKYIKSLKGPFPQAHLIPTGGVNASNAAEYVHAGAFALGVGADLVDSEAIRQGNLKKVSDAARELMQAVKAARNAL